MTLLDFRSGGHQGTRGSFARSGHEEAVGDWHPDDDWAGGRYATEAAPERLTDRDSLLGRAARLTHYVGAVVSITLMVGLGIWGYRLVVRDVSGVPVIRAVEGEARIVPDEPGGKLSDRTGLAVNEIAGGAEPSSADRVAIAPAPTALDGQDVAMGELGATAREGAITEEAVPAPAEATIALTDAEAAARAATEQAGIAAGVPAVAPGETDATPVDAAVTTADGQPIQATAIHAALAEAGIQPPVAAARPAPRPRRIAAAASAGTRTDATPPAIITPVEAVPAPEPVKAAKVASGAPLVQIGAFDSDAIAQSEWSRISGRFGGLFAGKAPVVQKHQANGRTFYRLRIAGFDSRDDARRFCAALIEAGTDCIPAAAK